MLNICDVDIITYLFHILQLRRATRPSTSRNTLRISSAALAVYPEGIVILKPLHASTTMQKGD